MDYKEFINLKFPVKDCAILGGSFRSFNDFCKYAMSEWEDGNEKYMGYRFTYVPTYEAVLGTRFDEYIILPSISPKGYDKEFYRIVNYINQSIKIYGDKRWILK